MIAGQRYPLKREDDPAAGTETPGLNWVLEPTADMPLAAVREAVHFALQITDADDQQLERPLEGIVRVRADAPPRVAAAVITQSVLPTAAPTIYLRATDDFGLASLVLVREVLHPDGQTEEGETAIYALPDAEPPQKNIEINYAFPLGPLKLSKGDSVKVTVRATDFRGRQKDGRLQDGKSTLSEPLVFQVTDEQGVLAAMIEADRQSAAELKEMIQRQLVSENRHEKLDGMVPQWAGPGGRRFSGTRPNAPGRKPPAAAAGAAAGAGHGPRAGRLGHRRAASAAQGERADRQSALRRRPRHARAARRLDRRPDAGSRAAAGEGGIGRPRRAPEGFLAAREKSREVVVRLLVERQNLVRRLKVAEMAAQVEQLIQVQKKVLGATEALPNQPPARRETLNLSALEDQRDVRALFKQLGDSLGEASRETGPLSDEAGAGLKLIQDNGVAGDLATAENRLQGASFAEAAASQRAVISKLETLLSKIQEAEGIKEPNQSDTAQRIRELSKRQEQLRDATQRARPQPAGKREAGEPAGRPSQANRQFAGVAVEPAGRAASAPDGAAKPPRTPPPTSSTRKSSRPWRSRTT